MIYLTIFLYGMSLLVSSMLFNEWQVPGYRAKGARRAGHIVGEWIALIGWPVFFLVALILRVIELVGDRRHV